MAVIYDVFGDESHDEENERVFAVAGVLGDEADWQTATEAWTNRTRGRIFHASDCECDLNDFSESSHAENLRLYADLAKILAGSRLMGFGAAMSLEDYDKFFAPSLRNNAYYLCFRTVILYLGRMARRIIPQGIIRFTFDHNLETENNAAKVYDFVVNMPGTDFKEYFDDEISFSSRRNPKIQVADLMARETMKHFDNQFGPVYRISRRSFQTLADSKRFAFEFYTKHYFADLVQKANDLAKGQGYTTILQEFTEWRAIHNNAPDTLEVRIRYAMSQLKQNPEVNPF